NCTGDGYCYSTSSGFGSCTDRYYPSEPWCKFACPNCPAEPCSGGGGGGGGGGCGAPFVVRTPDPSRTVASFGVLFQSDPDMNTQIFGPGQAYRVITDGITGFTATSAAHTIGALATGGAGSLRLAFAFSNFNNGSIPVS